MNVHRLLVIAVVLFAELSWVADVSAGVNLRNGNFYVSYTDMIHEGGVIPELTRSYNSRGTFKSMFGVGWASDFETYLRVQADGSLVVFEHGGGSHTAFNPDDFSASEVEAAIEAIVRAAREAQDIKTNRAAAQLRRDLSSPGHRADSWEKYSQLGLLTAREMPIGSVLRSGRGSEYIERLRDGYLRVAPWGRIDRFADDGRLLRSEDEKANFIEIAYDEDRRLSTIVDNLGRTVAFTFDGRGLLEKVVGATGQTAVYRHNHVGYLVYSKDAGGNEYEYEYDDMANLVRIGYSDKSAMEMEYWGSDRYGSIKSVKQRDGTKLSYKDTIDPADPLHSTVEVLGTNAEGRQVSTKRYDFFERTDRTGARSMHKQVVVEDGVRTEKEYDPTGSLVRIDNAGAVTTFQNDPAGQVTSAKQSTGRSVSLRYDAAGRIDQLKTEDGKIFEVAYDVDSKPTLIRQTADGATQTLRVEYDGGGEVKNMESDAGSTVAARIRDAFRELLRLLEPAGVSLSL